MRDRKTLFLIDGSSYIFRAFYAIGHLSNPTGLPTNAVFGFTQMLLRLLKEHRPDYLAVTLDSRAPTFRSEVYSEYKANRPPMPEGLVPQIPYIKKILTAYGVARVEMDGYEADDLIGTLAKKLMSQVDIMIVTGDKDILQLVGDRITVYDPMKEKKYGAAEVFERFGVSPEQMVEMMALAGDAIDNIPGVPGVGEKTAVQLIKRFGSLENLLRRLDEVPQKKLKERLETYGEQARLSRRLATICTDAPVACDLPEFSVKPPDLKGLKGLFKELGFGKLLRELPEEPGSPEGEYHLITDPSQWTALVERLKKADTFSIGLETTSPDPMRADLVGLSLSLSPGEAFYVPLGHRRLDGVKQLPLTWVMDQLKPLLEDEQPGKVGQNIKHEWIVLHRYGIRLRGICCDTMIASYLLDPTRHRHELTEIAREYLDRDPADYRDVVGSGQKALCFDEVAVDRARDYSCEEADVTLQLSRLLCPKLESEGLRDLFGQVEMPLLPVLAKMESHGVKIDTDLLRDFSKEIEGQLQQKMERIYRSAGEVFNINSSQQLGRILFDKLKLPLVKKTKTGYSTDADVLTRLSAQHDLPLEVLAFRTLSKLKSTYVDALPKLIHPGTGRVHTSYHQTVTATGRLSSSDPNLQNIPVRGEEGGRIRQAFIPEKGCLLVSADYSQIELRILGHLSSDDVLQAAFQRDEDIHARTAAEIFHVSLENVTSSMRREAKVINFGIVYGMSAYGLSQQIGTETKVAQAYIDEYFKKYAKVRAYIEAALKEAVEKGYVETLLRRRRYLPEIRSPVPAIRQAAERMAVNTPLQGTAADLMKLAMIRIQDRVDELRLASKMIMQVHDELVFEVPEDEMEEICPLIRREMEDVVRLSVPLKVSVQAGKNWAEIH